jgi:hypothetical protein
MTEKILTSLLTLLLPLIATYLSKMNKEYQLRSNLEAAQKKLDFINSYYETVNKLIPDTEKGTVKQQLLKELFIIKHQIVSIQEKDLEIGYQKLSTLEKIFLTFKPVSIIGFLLLISFYAILMFSSLMFIGMFVDDAGNFSTDIFIENILDPAISIALLVAILLLLLFRWLAVREYKHKST